MLLHFIQVQIVSLEVSRVSWHMSFVYFLYPAVDISTEFCTGGCLLGATAEPVPSAVSMVSGDRFKTDWSTPPFTQKSFSEVCFADRFDAAFFFIRRVAEMRPEFIFILSFFKN